MTNLKALCTDVCRLAKQTGSFIRQEARSFHPSHVESKGLHNFVSYVDKEAEKQIVDKLSKLLPEAGFIAEENTATRRSDNFNWVVDPLDGTTNFIHGLPCFSVSIALMEKEEVVLGVVYEVNRDECFYAWKGGGAFLNDSPMRVSDAKAVHDSLLATGFPYYDYSLLDQYIKLFTWCLRNSHGVRRMGSAAVDLAWVACGRFEGFFEYGLNAWDVAAGSLIVKEAGGKVCDFNGGTDYLFGRNILAANAGIHAELHAEIKRMFS